MKRMHSSAAMGIMLRKWDLNFKQLGLRIKCKFKINMTVVFSNRKTFSFYEGIPSHSKDFGN